MAVSISSVVLPPEVTSNFCKRALTAWKKATFSFTATAVRLGIDNANDLDNRVTSLI